MLLHSVILSLLIGVSFFLMVLDEASGQEAGIPLRQLFSLHQQLDKASKLVGMSPNFKAKGSESRNDPSTRKLRYGRSLSSKSIKSSKSSKALMASSSSSSDDLETCKSEVKSLKATLEASNQPHYLFVQMGNSCSLNRDDDGKYIVHVQDMDDDTYVFADRPWRAAGIMKTSSFFANYSAIFTEESGGKPNSAVTFVNSDTTKFEGPLVAVFIDAAYEDAGGTYSYIVEQSEDQAAVMSLEKFFPSDSSTSLQYSDCSFFIDSVGCHTGAVYCGDISVGGGGIYANVRNPFDP